jgi:tetratricopeptide (TPR) repeat protein
MKTISTLKRSLQLIKSDSTFFYAVVLTIAFSNMLAPLKLYAQKNFVSLSLNGIECEKKGDMTNAILNYSNAIAAKPQKFEGYTYRAIANYRLEKFDEALSDISQAITLSPNNDYLYNVRANCYYNKGDYAKAITDYNRALSKASNNAKETYETYFNRGRAYFYNKQFAEAIPDFTKRINGLVKYPETHSEVYYNWRARCYVEVGKYDEAVKDFDMYLTANSNDVSAVFYQGLAYSKTGDMEKAKASAARVIELDPSEGVLFSGDKLLDVFNLEKRRAEVKSSLALEEKSMQDLQQIPSKTLRNIKLNESFDLLRNAWNYSSRKTREDAVLNDTVLKRIFEVYPQLKEKPDISESARKYMVQAAKATEEKKYPESINLWYKALSISPYYPLAYYNRALLKGLLGDYQSAIVDMKKYVQLSPNANDVRVAQDKMYEWEGKMKNTIAALPVNDPLMQNKIINYKTDKMRFVMRGGLNNPTGNFATAPQIQIANSTQDMWQNALITKGNIGAQPGNFVEIGIECSILSTHKLGFYYNPVSVGYSSTPINWSAKNNSAFSDKSIYSKSMQIIEVSQKYGICYSPVSNLIAAVYYRPSLVMPISGSEIKYKSADAQTTFNFTSKVNDNSDILMGHTLGFSISYSFLVLTYETCIVKPKYDFNIKYQDAATSYEYNLTGQKLPFHTNRIGIAIKL